MTLLPGAGPDPGGAVIAALPSPSVTGGAAETRPTPAASIVRGALALLSTQPLTWAAGFLLTLFLPRYLGDTGLGVYALAVSIAGIAGLCCSLGVPDYLTRRIATNPAATEEGSAALLLLAGAGLIAAVALSLLLPVFGLASTRLLVVRIALAGMVATSAQSALLALLRGKEQHARFAWLNATGSALSAFIGVGVLMLGGGLTSFMLCGALVSTVVCLAGCRLAGIHAWRSAWNPPLWRQLLAGGTPFLGMAVATHIYAQTDALFLALLTRSAVLGWYSAAYRIIGIPMFIPILVTTPMLPALSRAVTNMSEFRNTLRRSLVIVLLLTLPPCSLILALAPSIPALLRWPATFQHSVPLMMILALHIPLVAIDMVLASGVFALRRERRWLRVSIAAAVVNPALNLALIPLCDRLFHNGAIGAAIVTVSTEFLMFAGALLLLPPGTITRDTALASARLVLVGVAMVVITMAVATISALAAVPAGCVVFAITVLGLRVVRPTEVRDLVSMSLGPLLRRRAETTL